MLFFSGFDNSPNWDDSKRRVPQSEEEYASWYLYADNRFPVYARRHFIKKGEESIKYVLPMLKDKNARIRFFALNTLGEIRSEKTLDIFVEGLYDDSSLVRAYCLETLSGYNSALWKDKSISRIKELLRDKDKTVCISAIRALSRCGSSEDAEVFDEATSGTLSNPVKETIEKNIEIARLRMAGAGK